MPTSLVLPDIRNKIGDLARRVGILERRIREEDPAATDSEIIFSLPDAVTATTSPKAYVRADARLVNVVCSLGTAGTTTTTVLVQKNGTTIGTISLTSGVTFKRARVVDGFVADTDYMTVTVSAAGTGAADLTVQARFA